MFIPRVFHDGQEVSRQQPWGGIHLPFVDLLIVCGQGAYEDGTFYGEFHDRDVYVEHALGFPETAERFNYTVVVASGGFTQPKAPWLSEAESFLRILSDAHAAPPVIPVILDEAALDSAENLLLGLMTARAALGKIPIRRIGIWAAWRFKKWRFNRNAEALGIVERTYFHGFSSSTATNVQVPPEDARQPTWAEYRGDSVEFGLLRTAEKEDKRRQRWQNNRFDPSRDASLPELPEGNRHLWARTIGTDSTPQAFYGGRLCSDYKNRLAMFQSFTGTWKAMERISGGAHPGDTDLKSAFLGEVIRPFRAGQALG